MALALTALCLHIYGMPAGDVEARLAADAVVVGLSDRVEIWPPDRWTSYRAGMADPDEFAARLAGLAI